MRKREYSPRNTEDLKREGKRSFRRENEPLQEGEETGNDSQYEESTQDWIKVLEKNRRGRGMSSTMKEAIKV